jgi:hypothetical protein
MEARKNCTFASLHIPELDGAAATARYQTFLRGVKAQGIDFCGVPGQSLQTQRK